MIKGEIVSEVFPNGTERYISKDFPRLPEKDQQAVAEIIRRQLRMLIRTYLCSGKERPRLWKITKMMMRNFGLAEV